MNRPEGAEDAGDGHERRIALAHDGEAPDRDRTPGVGAQHHGPPRCPVGEGPATVPPASPEARAERGGGSPIDHASDEVRLGRGQHHPGEGVSPRAEVREGVTARQPQQRSVREDPDELAREQ